MGLNSSVVAVGPGKSPSLWLHDLLFSFFPDSVCFPPLDCSVLVTGLTKKPQSRCWWKFEAGMYGRREGREHCAGFVSSYLVSVWK